LPDGSAVTAFKFFQYVGHFYYSPEVVSKPRLRRASLRLGSRARRDVRLAGLARSKRNAICFYFSTGKRANGLNPLSCEHLEEVSNAVIGR